LRRTAWLAVQAAKRSPARRKSPQTRSDRFLFVEVGITGGQVTPAKQGRFAEYWSSGVQPRLAQVIAQVHDLLLQFHDLFQLQAG